MLVKAGKYTDVRAGSKPARTVPHIGPHTRAPQSFKVQSSKLNVQSSASGLNIFVPNRKKGLTLPQWFERECRTGGYVHEYLRRERYLTEQRARQVARVAQHRKPNPKSDFKLVAQIHGRDFHRWRRTDPDFWRDDNNLRSLRRDNDTYRHLIHV